MKKFSKDVLKRNSRKQFLKENKEIVSCQKVTIENALKLYVDIRISPQKIAQRNLHLQKCSKEILRACPQKNFL